MEPVRVLVDDVNQQAWVAVAHSTRIDDRMVSRIGAPAPGSNFARTAELFSYEKVSDRARAYLRAGIDHLLMWADYSAPLKFHDEQVINFTLRPTLTLARAAIEASAQAVWLMDTTDPFECIRRHISLMHWDLNEHWRSKNGDSGEQAAIDLRRRQLLHRVSGVFKADDVKPPKGYEQIIMDACAANGLDLGPTTASRLWRAASGAAHGKYWANLDMQNTHEGVLIPDPAAMTEVLEAAHKITTYGVIRFADYMGADIQSILDEAVTWLAQTIPMRDDASREEMDRLLKTVERRSQEGPQS